MAELTHLNEKGHAAMVDVGGKAVTTRTAVARGEVRMAPETLAAILDGSVPKGDVLAAARIAGIMGAKRTPDLIPLCHPLLLTKAEVEFAVDEPGSRVVITATVRSAGQTGVEMEALTAVSVAALTIYDMAKALEKGMVIADVRLLEKHGGKSGDWVRAGAGETPTTRSARRPMSDSMSNSMSDSMSDSVKPTVSDPVSPAAGARPARLPRYAPLLTFLADMDPGDDEKTLTFQQVELLLGHKVPASAREHVQWWANTESHVQAQSWLRAGWRVDGLSLAQEWVRFRRQER